jgi:hypothetical protein
MTPELSFLLDLVLNHRLQKATKDHIASRIKEIEELRVAQSPAIIRPTPQVGQQAPSMMAKVAAMEAEKAMGGVPMVDTPAVGPEPVTMAAAQALMDRQNLINSAVNAGPFGMKQEGRKSPRKF